MSEKQSVAGGNTELKNFLLGRHGALLTLPELAALLRRTPDGLRISLASSREEWAQKIRASKLKLGRRVLFRTADIADLLVGHQQ